MLSPNPAGEAHFSGSYAPEDVRFLLRPVTLRPTPVAEKERMIQSGRRHYSEMIPPEEVPDEAYLALYRSALERNGVRLAADLAALAAALAQRSAGRSEIVVASLARAGTPVGILVVRALRAMGLRANHYSISIIRDRGIDLEALAWIAGRHDPADVVFLDGWTGKGAISAELRRSLAGRPLGFEPFLAVVADPAGRADLAATGDDYLIPSGILGSIVSGLVSRSILNEALVGPGQFHACVYHGHLAPADLSSAFVEAVAALMPKGAVAPAVWDPRERSAAARDCDSTIAAIQARFDVDDRNRVKPGIAEATRALLRRVPDRLLVQDPADPDLAHLMALAAAKGVAVEPLAATGRFRTVAIIRSVASPRNDHGRD
ncbi:MAG TPA: cysteine protease StiP domain-containing protein [Allosphingosinicella sp.]|nr:cysteine protease StiP domain-containing protein [Allosphingosinicella sp.]